MCGIAGYAGGFVPRLIARMNRAQQHRGPDGDGAFEDPAAEIGLGHVRLAILDLTSAAAQPMTSPDGQHVLVFNGEIYNYRELRDSLTQHGWQFRSTGDTEVLLAGLAIHGPVFTSRLNGIFAFAYWNTARRELVLARDRMGTKPLYFASPKPGTLLFASEIKALCAHPDLRREPDFDVIQQHLQFCYATGERTALKGVERLPPGTLLRWTSSARTARIEAFWSPQFEHDSPGTFADASRGLRDAVQTAVRSQLVSDVPLGSMLSGGLDSTLLTVLAAESQPKIECFATTYSTADNRVDQTAEDAPYARRIAKERGLSLTEFELKPELHDLLPRLMYHLDEPLADPATLACYLICRDARARGVKVLLSGQGADELFAGYPRYWVLSRTAWWDRTPQSLRRGLANVASLLPGAWPGRIGAAIRRTRRVLLAAPQSAAERFVEYSRSNPQELALSLWQSDLRDQLCRDDTVEANGDWYVAAAKRDLGVYLPNHNLLYSDKMSMATGVEARVPFLDNDIVDLACRLPAAWKVARGETKVILRDAARSVVPTYIIDRPKAGFGAPYRTWLQRDLADVWSDLTSPQGIARRGWFDGAVLEACRNDSLAGRVDTYMLQWSVLCLELWAREFLDRNPAEARLPEPRTLARAA
ncbi:MAG TPA: asparagine synthase (glutamine-hydrolyzing) [Planctomycetaceae bacterium]|nr:asparagine synthase (glutamine-hydrolyzing) [Planctomycetaceae bacterium]